MPYRSKAKEAADARYRANNKEKRKARVKNVAAGFIQPEGDQILAEYTGAGVTPAEVIRAGAYRLAHDPGAADAIRADAAAWRADHPGDFGQPGRPRKGPPETLAAAPDGQKDTGPENSPQD